MSFRGARGTRNLKDPALCSGYGFLPEFILMKIGGNDKLSCRAGLIIDNERVGGIGTAHGE
jgi:hypothetical protein